jgi:hypothetical protein
MKRMRFLAAVLLVALAATGLSCLPDRSPTAPAIPPPNASLIGGLLQATGLLQCTPLPYASTTKTIGPAGGTITVGPHTLVIPPGALSQNVTITAEAPSANVNSVRFTPQGLRFSVSAALTMSYSNCNLLGKLLPKEIAYTDDNLNILSYLISLDNLLSKRVTGKLDHFSRYAVAW